MHCIVYCFDSDVYEVICQRAVLQISKCCTQGAKRKCSNISV